VIDGAHAVGEGGDRRGVDDFSGDVGNVVSGDEFGLVAPRNDDSRAF
jgi:hypothetical protein